SPQHREGGNDYPFGYLFKSRALTTSERDDWHGGIDLAVLAAAEQRAFAWHEWYKHHTPAGIDPNQISLVTDMLGTAHGLAKLPYLRDPRRSVGLDGFVLRISDLTKGASRQTGTRFDDRIAIGAYTCDVHALANCEVAKVPPESHKTLPFYIPFRALTNQK